MLYDFNMTCGYHAKPKQLGLMTLLNYFITLITSTIYNPFVAIIFLKKKKFVVINYILHIKVIIF